MSASPEFFNPAPPPPRLLLATAPKLAPPPPPAADDDEYLLVQTPKGAGISSLGDAAATCPPAPMKPRHPPASACKKRLFAAAATAVAPLRFHDLDAIFRPLSDGTRRRRRSQDDRLGVGAATTMS